MKLSQARRAAAAALRAAGIEGGARDADRILAAILGFAPQRLRLVDDRDLNPVEIARLDRDIAARAARQPVAQIVGFRDFYAHRFRVTRDTLDPRPETETLVTAALDRFPDPSGSFTVVDLETLIENNARVRASIPTTVRY